MICRKCEAPGTILIRKEYWYCNTCFITNTNHKFRASIGKSKILSPKERVLICLSGDANSIVLMDLIHSAISLDGTKKLRIIPFFLHIIETETKDNIWKAKLLIEQCKKYDFDLYVVHISNYYSTKYILPEPNIIEVPENETLSKTKLNVSPTIYLDVILKIKRQIFLGIANELSCKIVFTAETTTQLAKKLLSNLAIGRGSQVENDIGFADRRHDTIQILRPIKDISNEEIDYYVRVKQINYVDVDSDTNTEIGLQSVIDKFVLDLQENFPSTISTLCKTADKLASVENNSNEKCCTFCQSNIALKSTKLSSVEATIFSRQMCLKQVGENDEIENMQNVIEDENTMFPSLYETLCYSCSRNFAELDDCSSTILGLSKNKDVLKE